jgi:heptosyltransferase I
MMSSIVFVKTSSLGDVIHHMPAVTDTRRACPDAHIAWVVEAPYAPLVALHPGVDEILPVATRRWRQSWYKPETIAEIRNALSAMRSRRYEIAIDTQGLMRSAILTQVIRGKRHGYDRDSIRERAATFFYDVKHAVPRTLHAIDRNRALTGAALGYTPQGALDFGLRPQASAHPRDYAVLLHGSAGLRKEWSDENWLFVGRALAAAGVRAVLPWGSLRERERAERLAAQLPRAEARGGEGLGAVAQMIAGARLVIGLDTGLLHLAAAYAVPLIGVFVASDPTLTAPRGTGLITILGAPGEPPAATAVTAAIPPLLGA